eukprot:6193052-Pleurochrysis_carterae.AAC.2
MAYRGNRTHATELSLSAHAGRPPPRSPHLSHGRPHPPAAFLVNAAPCAAACERVGKRVPDQRRSVVDQLYLLGNHQRGRLRASDTKGRRSEASSQLQRAGECCAHARRAFP